MEKRYPGLGSSSALRAHHSVLANKGSTNTLEHLFSLSQADLDLLI